jgi:hypothetical protein
VILDPRYKLQFVEWGYDKLYGKESRELKDVSGTLFALFGSYMDKFSHLLVSNPVNQTPTQIKVGDKLFEVVFIFVIPVFIFLICIFILFVDVIVSILFLYVGI